jgi:DMSO/TMAO reductase YedYZ molybdopterin-dependent catalytic subunit
LSCGDGHSETLSVEELTRNRVFFCGRRDGEFLAPEYGSPLRLIVLWEYGYKGAKCAAGIEFAAAGSPALMPDTQTAHNASHFNELREARVCRRIALD